MASATQSVPVNVYLVDLILPFGAVGYPFPGAQVFEFAPGGAAPIRCLSGATSFARGRSRWL